MLCAISNQYYDITAFNDLQDLYKTWINYSSSAKYVGPQV